MQAVKIKFSIKDKDKHSSSSYVYLESEEAKCSISFHASSSIFVAKNDHKSSPIDTKKDLSFNLDNINKIISSYFSIVENKKLTKNSPYQTREIVNFDCMATDDKGEENDFFFELTPRNNKNYNNSKLRVKLLNKSGLLSFYIEDSTVDDFFEFFRSILLSEHFLLKSYYDNLESF